MAFAHNAKIISSAAKDRTIGGGWYMRAVRSTFLCGTATAFALIPGGACTAQASGSQVGAALAPSLAAASQPVVVPLGASTSSLDEIIVTAQKRSENLQKVPISITALSAAALEIAGIRSVSDFQRVPIPGLTTQSFAGNAQVLLLDLRGVTTSDPGQGTVEPGVAVYVDDVYVSRAQGAGNNLSDPERIEVLKGPQGTLFGRNAEGGAIRIVTKKPTGEFGGDALVSIGDYGTRHYQAHLNLPKIAGFSVKLDFIHDDLDGYTKNGTAPNPLLAEQRNFGAQNITGYRGAVRWQPISELTIDYSYEHLNSNVANDYFGLTDPGFLVGATRPATFTPPARTREPDIHAFNDTSWTGLYQDQYRDTTRAHTLNVAYALNDRLTLKSITGYRKLGFSGSNNLGGAFAFVNSPFLIPAGSTVASLGIVPAISGQTLGIPSTTPVYAIGASDPIVNEVSSKAFSQELQVVGSTDTLQYVFGVYYYHEDVSDVRTNSFTVLYTNPTYSSFLSVNPFLVTSPVARGALGTGGATSNDTVARSYAAFSQVTWSPDFADNRLHLTGGLRYTDDAKTFLRTLNNGVAVNLVGAPFSTKRFDPAGTIAYDVTPRVNAYFRYAQGYKAGGVGIRSPNFASFGLETNRAYEAGVKADLLDRRLRANVAVFENDIQNRQLAFQPNPSTAPAVTDIVNTPGTTRVRGVEVEFVAAPTAGLTFSLNGAYTKFRLPAELIAANAALPVSAQGIYTVQNTPEWAASAALDYSLPRFNFGAQLAFHVDYSFASNDYGVARRTASAFTYLTERHQGNAKVTLRDIPVGPTKIRLSGYLNNLTNEIYPIYTAATANYIQNPPRTYGIEIGASF